MFGTNVKMQPVFGDNSILYIKKIFLTIQGEGPFVGMPTVFVRLAGCNLACKFCDTEFEDGTYLKIDEIIDQIHLKSSFNTNFPIKLVVLTGGEPFRQPIELLCRKFLDNGYIIQIETNGTIYRDLPNSVNIVCSPKASKGSYHQIDPRLLPKINAFKFLSSHNIEPYTNVPDLGQKYHKIETFIQPIDTYNLDESKKNYEHAVNLALQTGYRLSLQIHKILQID